MDKTIKAEGGYDGSQTSSKTGKMLTYSKKEIDDAVSRSDRASRIYDNERTKIERKLYSLADRETQEKAGQLFRPGDEAKKRELLWSYAEKNRPAEYKKLKEQNDNAKEEMRVITTSTGNIVMTFFSDGEYRSEQ